VAIVLSISAAPRLRGARESNPLHAAIDVASLDDPVAEDERGAAQWPPRVRRERVDADTELQASRHDGVHAARRQIREPRDEVQTRAAAFDLRGGPEMLAQAADQDVPPLAIAALHPADVAIVVAGAEQFGNRAFDEP